MLDTTYDRRCEDAEAAAEARLVAHFEEYGGDVWTIGSGCHSCRATLNDVVGSGLKRCAPCGAALFCGRACQVRAWPAHKAECCVIATFKRLGTSGDTSESKLASLLETLTFSTCCKKVDGPKTAGVASSIGMSGSMLPGWFFAVDYEQAPKEQQKGLYQAVLELYGLLKDDECWTRDKESFPRSSYTLVESLPRAFPAAAKLQAKFVEMNGPLLLFSAWLQHPEPPATQATPLEDRSFFGVVDSLLQISTLRDSVDAFMQAE
ncbi:unnamed protein product [Hyaloperonospora brassicae]|uniref:MYND-type domain-containing protein n=1 Tax=Hyaloperonospora brassicae TaxID=162125 RepID=A0AAV0TJF0_HYABA|nr:unnamed protein product [Hyaloperonospora brassicae]